MLVKYLYELLPGDFERALTDGLGGIGGIFVGGDVIPGADPLVGLDGMGGGGPMSSLSIFAMSFCFDMLVVLAWRWHPLDQRMERPNKSFDVDCRSTRSKCVTVRLPFPISRLQSSI
jgi:hypothetical protein